MSEKLIYQNHKTKLYYIKNSKWQHPVLLKVLNYEFPSAKDINQFYNEFELLEGKNIKGVRKVLERTKVKNRPALYLEWVEGKTIEEVFKDKAGDIVDFLHIAIAATKALFQLHQHHIIHKDISGTNIIVNLEERAVKIIGLDIASTFATKQQHFGNLTQLDGTLAYSSPEQTGRINRTLDYRSDLYSLGIVFYQILSGQLPFLATDPLELVHAHIAQIPTPLHQFNLAIPEQLSLIIDKLLSKNAENRYQSAKGIQSDFENCLQQLEQTGTIDYFPLGAQDFSGKFQIPERLYGRSEEIDLIHSAFLDSASGALKIVMIAGFSGTGKSALVYELYKPITSQKGYFVEGKFDQYQRAVPYFAVLKALDGLIDLLLVEPENQLNRLRKELLNALGSEGKVLTNVLPKLNFIIGEQPELPQLRGTEAQNRFSYVLRKFIQVLATKQRPLVLFIDDVQWADSASLHLLKSLLTDPNGGYLLCLMAYRNNEIDSTHPLLNFKEELIKQKTDLRFLEIDNLSKNQVQQLIADSINQEKEVVETLARLVYEKTAGNAFFVNQFLLSLYEEGLLNFNFEQFRWQWDIQKIKGKNIEDNVVALMAAKVRRLPAITKDLLKLAACVGNSFEEDILSLIRKQPSNTFKTDLEKALQEGLIIHIEEGTYKFSHDRIQQAVYSLLTETVKNKTHYTIGKILYKNSNKEERENKLFDIVNQLNFGINNLEETEHIFVANLNLQAGKRAKLNAAFRSAFDYLKIGIQLLGNSPWKNQRPLCLALHVEVTEVAYLCGDFETMDRYYIETLKHANNILEVIKPHETKISAHKAENNLLEAIQIGLNVLAQLGEQFPKNPNTGNVLFDYLKTNFFLYNKDKAYFENLPKMENPYKIAAVRMIADIMPSVYWATPKLVPILVLRMLRLSLKYGNDTVSPFAYASYGVIECGFFGHMRNGQKFGQIALTLLDKFDNKEWKAQIYNPIFALIVHWNQHARNAFQPLKDTYHIGLETGAIEFACVNTNLYCINAFLAGVSLNSLEKEIQIYNESYVQLKQETNLNYNQVFHQTILNFMGETDHPTQLIGRVYDEHKMMAQNLERNDQTGTFFIHFNKLILCYHFQAHTEAAEHAQNARNLLEAVLAKFEIPNHHYYEALNLIALLPKTTRNIQRKYWRTINKNILQLKNWSKYSPENYLHKYQLLLAEKKRLKRDFYKASQLYDQAIEGAAKQDYIHEQALAYELAGKFYLAQNAHDLTVFYLKSAHNCYQQWGAIGKTAFLEERYSQYIVHSKVTNRNTASTFSSVTTTDSLNSQSLDITTVIKAATAISGEVKLSRLLTLLMNLVLKNAGAQRGVLLLETEGDLFIEARQDVFQKDNEILSHIPLSEVNDLAISLIHYVQRTKESLILNKTNQDARFQQDPYIQNYQPKSVVCLPIINQGKSIGILYLENNSTSEAFTSDRLQLLTLLSGQIAVSIDNALLYKQMEQKVAERTVALAREKQKSDDLLYNILPRETAEELKQYGKTAPKKYEQVSVLFTDFVGFSKMAKVLSPEALVELTGIYFSAFDAIIKKNRLEKIKTIGDAYMCAGGLPVPNSTNAENAVQAALEIINWITQFNQAQEVINKPFFEIRIGIHTGPVVAGIVGTDKFAYDIWGDTVNTASRMESSSEQGQVNISETTYGLVEHKFNCIYRGKIDVKNIGKIDMYFVTMSKTVNQVSNSENIYPTLTN